MMEPESAQSTGNQLPNGEEDEHSTRGASDAEAAADEAAAEGVDPSDGVNSSASSPATASTPSDDDPPLDPKLLLAPEPSTSMRTRLRFVVPDEALTVRVDPQTLPDSPIDASLWDIVPKVAGGRSISV